MEYFLNPFYLICLYLFNLIAPYPFNLIRIYSFNSIWKNIYFITGLGQAIGSERYGLGNDSKEYLQCKKAMNDKIAEAVGLLRRAPDMLLTVDSPSTSVLSEGSTESQSMLYSVAESVN